MDRLHLILLILCGIVASTSCERRAPAPREVSDADEASTETLGVPPTAASPRDDAAPSGVGVVSGRVVYRGPLPESTTMFILEAGGELEAHTVIVDPETRGLKNAVVWVEDGPPGAPVASLPSVKLDQRDWSFVPHVLAVRAGQTVVFLNSDVANHNVHSLSPGNAFNVGTPAGDGITYTFRKPTGTRPARLDCDIHEWMRAWVYVFREDTFAVTDPEGSFRIEGVPTGRRRLRIHHADGELEATIEVVVEKDRETRVEAEIGAAAKSGRE